MAYPKLTPIVATGATEPRYIADRFADIVCVKDFGAKGDGTTDDTVAIQSALDAGRGPVFFPAGIYCVSDEIVVPDGSGIVGMGPFWKVRKTFQYDSSITVIKYIGSGGENSCVVRYSEKPAGQMAQDFSTDDLINAVGRDFHVDANNLADFGVYVYRAGNMTRLGNITAEKAKKYNHVHLGCYAAVFGTFGAYESEEHGVAVGWNLFNWNSTEYTCFAYSASFLLRFNGTSQTYVAGGDHDLDNTGGKFNAARGSRINIVGEASYGRACILSTPNSADWTSGSVDYCLDYIESNADGPYIEYKNGADGIAVHGGFFHPGNGTGLAPQNIKIEAKNNDGEVVANGGPSRYSEWLRITGVNGYTQVKENGVVTETYNIEIDSNTYKFKVDNCDNTITYPNSAPAVQSDSISAGVFFTAASTPAVFEAVNGTLTRTGAGAYTFTFTHPFKASGKYIPHLSVVYDAGSPFDTEVRLTNISTTLVAIKVYNGSGAATDTGDRIAVSIVGELQ